MTQMTPAERAATEAFHADLLEQFKTNADEMWKAFATGDFETYNVTVETNRALYREIREVEFCLTNNVLPDDITEASR